MQYIIISALIVPLIVGLLLGMLRGSRRATLRIILVILCLVAAFLLRGVVTDKVMQIQINGQPLEQFIASQLPEDFASMTDTIMPIITLIVTALVFLILFFSIKFISWAIIYPICKIFVKKARKKKDGTYGKKHALIGGVIGLVQGAAVALVLCVMLNGLFINLGSISEMASDLQNSSNGNTNAVMLAAETADGGEETADQGGEQDNGGEESGSPMDAIMQKLQDLASYKESGICKAISKVGGNKMFDFVVSVKTEEGKKLTLTGQVDALGGLAKMAKELSAIQNMDLVGGLSDDVASDMAGIFNRLDEICGSLSEESKDTLNSIVQNVAGSLLPENSNLDLSVIDFNTVSFSNEGEVITRLNTYKDTSVENITPEVAKDVVEIVMQSDIILPLLSSNDQFTIGLNDEQQEYAENVILELEQKPDSDKEKIEMLKKFFGLNDNGGIGESGGNGGETPAPEQPAQPEA